MPEQKISDFIYVHGVFMEIFGKGVLLKGQSGIGKSETALSLMDRGSSLIADDSIIFHLSDCGTKIVGKSPKKLKDFLEIRGLGILNMRHLLGDHVLKNEAFLSLILNFIPFSFEKSQMIHPVKPIYSQKELLGMSFPEITLSVLPGRNTALVVETAVRYHQQYQHASQYVREEIEHAI